MTVVSEAMKESQAPDFERALRVMENDVAPGIEDMASLRGDLSAAWKLIEDECRCNKQAAKVFNTKVRKASAENAADFIRTFIGLCKAGGHMDTADLVDQMEAAAPAAGEEDAETPAEPVTAKGKAADTRPALH